MSSPNIHIFETSQELASTAAETFIKQAKGATEEFGRFTVALAGGSTPKRAYEILATQHHDTLDWNKVHAFFGDERIVPPDHEDSNYRMAQDTLLSHVPIGSVHRMRGELDPSEAAALYEKDLEVFFGGPPRFDLVLLGIGEDGHTASLFPGTPALDVRDRWAVENPVEKLGTSRITLTVPAINAATRVVFLVAGEGKAKALKEILEVDAETRDCPAKLIRPVGKLTWMSDAAAASSLS